MNSKIKSHIKYTAKIRLAVQESQQSEDVGIKSFSVGDFEMFDSGEELEQAASLTRGVKTSAKKGKNKPDYMEEDAPFYFEDTNPISVYDHAEGTSAEEVPTKVRSRTTLHDAPTDVGKPLGDVSLAPAPELDEEMKEELNRDKSDIVRQDRLDLIMQRHKARQSGDVPKPASDAIVAPLALEAADIEEDFEVVSNPIDEPEEKKEIEEAEESVAEGIVDKEFGEEEANPKFGEEDLDDVEYEDDTDDDADDADAAEVVEEGEKKRGRKPGSKSEGRSIQLPFMKIDEARTIAYDIANLKSYGMNDRQIDKIFDFENYIEELRKKNPKAADKLQKSGDEPEMWEMIAPHVSEAKEKDIDRIKESLESLLINFGRVKTIEVDVDALKFNSKPGVIKKKKDIINKFITKTRRDQRNMVVGLNDLEAKFMLKYYTEAANKMKALVKKKINQDRGLTDTMVELKETADRAKAAEDASKAAKKEKRSNK